MVDRYYGSYEAISIPSYESLSAKTISSESNQESIQITHDMVHQLRCIDEHHLSSILSIHSTVLSAPTPQVSEAGDMEYILSQATINYDNTDGDGQGSCKHQLMIIYEAGDINCALYFLIKSLVNPFACNAVATVLVEERLYKEFVQRVVQQMQPMTPNASTDPKFLATLAKLETLHLETITAEIDYPDVSPILVFDCQHSQLGEGTTGVICVRTFRSTLEAIDICVKEIMMYGTISIWNESIEDLYQLVVSVNCSTFFFNCNDVTLHPIVPSLASNKTDACVFDGFHYETLQINNEMKTIVFPIGAHLAQKSNEQHVMISPISFLNE